MSVLLFHWRTRFPGYQTADNSPFILGLEINWTHLLEHTSLGIQWFFLLSGYSFYEKYKCADLTGHAVLIFWKIRALRILPALWVLVFTLNVVTYFIRGNFNFFDLRILIGNLLLWQSPLPGGVRPYSINLWTLPVEFSFYLLFPLLLFVRNKTSNWFLLVVALAISFTWRQLLILVNPGINLDAHYFWINSIPGSLAFFVLGMYALEISENLPERWEVLGLLSSIIFYILWREYRIVFLGNPGHSWFIVSAWDLVRAIVSALILAIIVSGKIRNNFLRSSILLELGKRSYGIYLWHLPILWLSPKIFLIQGATPWECLQLLAICLILTLSIAAFTLKFIEKPIMKKWGRERSRVVDTPATLPLAG